MTCGLSGERVDTRRPQVRNQISPEIRFRYTVEIVRVLVAPSGHAAADDRARTRQQYQGGPRQDRLETSAWLRFQVRDPHYRDHAAIVERLFFRARIAGPGVILLSRKGLAFLLNAKFAIENMTDHRIHHRWSFGFGPT